jgi:two-component system cell cycle sensor histidine kinase/response regulator CckA
MHLNSPSTMEIPSNPWPNSGMAAKVLIVEDNDIVSDCLQTILRAYGYDPILAVTPDQAVEHCQREKNAIVALIADVKLGHFGGFATAQTLIRICPGMKVIFTSGYPYEHLVRTGMLQPELGAAKFLQKPFLASEIILALQLNCQSRQESAQTAR